MDNKDLQKTKYFNTIHRVGRIGSVLSIGAMLLVPYLIAVSYSLRFDLKEILAIASTLLAVFIPTVLAEFISYGPILGSGTYLAYITGNVTNLKIPCALNAQALMNLEQGSEESDVISLIAIASSSLITMLIIALGVVLLIPLQPFLQSEPVQVASKYILPALFGSLFYTMLSGNKSGKNTVKNKLLPLCVPAVIMIIWHLTGGKVVGKEGIWIVISIIMSVICAKIMLKTGLVKIIPANTEEKK